MVFKNNKSSFSNVNEGVEEDDAVGVEDVSEEE